MGKILYHGNRQKEKGLTVLETVIALSVIVIVSIAAVSIAISTSNSFNTISVKRFFQREIDNISEIYLTYDETNFSKGFKDLTGKEISGHTDSTYYLDATFNYVNDDENYTYKLVLDFDTSSLEVKATKADDSVIRSRSVSK